MININWSTWILDLLPPTHRTQRTKDWLAVFFNEIEYRDQWLKDYWEETRYEIQHNGHIMSLEHYLNDKLQPSGGTIFVDRSADYTIDQYNYMIQDHTPTVYQTYLFSNHETIFRTEETFLYNISEGTKPKTYLFNQSEIDADQIDFDVCVKHSDYHNTTFIIHVIDTLERYKLAGMTYHIHSY